MKHFTQLRTWLTMLLLFVGVSVSWGEEVTFTYSNYAQQGTQNSGSSYTMDDQSYVSIGDSKFYGNTSYAQFYAGGVITVTPKSGATITKMAITTTNTSYNGYQSSGTFKVSTGSVAKNASNNAIVEWTGKATSAFTIEHDKQIRWTSIVVIYNTSDGGESQDPVLYTVTFGDDNTDIKEKNEGEGVNLPSRNDKGNYVFIGWTTTNLSSETTTKPNVIESGNYKPSKDITLYPVYKRAETNSPTDYSVSTNIADYATANSWQGSGAVAYKSITMDDNITVSTTGITNNGKYYNDWRLYQGGNGNAIVTAKNGFTINSVKFTFSTSNNGCLKYGNKTIDSNDIVTVTSNPATFVVANTGNATNGQVRITAIEVSYSEEGQNDIYYTSNPEEQTVDPTKILTGIATSGTPEALWKGDDFIHNGITVIATYSDDTTEDVTASAEYTGYDMSTAGTQTVTVTYQGQTATYDVEVKTIANTQETAYTVAEAIALIVAGKDLATEVYVKGTVSEIVTAWSDQYNNITYNISDDGAVGSNQFQLYRCATNGAEIGDNVIGKGTLKKHNSTYEFEAGNVIVDIQKPAQKTITALTVSGTPAKTTYNVGDAFETEGLVVTATYSDETTATITTGFDWEIDYGTGNEALVAGATSVDVMVYTEDDVMSEVYTVNGLTVNVPTPRPENEIFYESFDTNEGKGGNDDTWSGDIAKNTLKSDNEGWLFEKGNGAFQSAKFGAGSALGYATTPKIDASGNFTLTFKAAAWNSSNESTTLKLSATGATLSASSVALTKGTWDTYNVIITNATEGFTITFEGNAKNNSRFFLDEVSIVALPNTAVVTLNDACHDADGMVYGTFSLDKPWVVPTNLVVSEISIIDGALYVESYKASDVVPANTGVMVSATEGGDYTVEIETDPEVIAMAESVLGESNCLHPSSEEMTGDNLFYRLTMHNGTQIGYWWGAADGAAFSLAANKAYLAVPKTAGVKANMWIGGDEDAIKSVEKEYDTVIYDMQGRKVSKAQKGLYIVNGKKVVR